MREIQSLLKAHGMLSNEYQSAFSTDIYDALETDTCTYVVSNENFCETDLLGTIHLLNEYKRFKKIYDQLIEESRMHFESAASYHFRLEEIYSKNTSFEKNERLFDLITNKINVVFNK
jgi:hypothetical protein